MATEEEEIENELAQLNLVIEAAWAEINAYGEKEEAGTAGDSIDPVYRHATAFHDIYMTRRPGPIAGIALIQAIHMWNLVEDGNQHIEAALERIGDDEEAISQVIPTVWYACEQSQHQSEAEAMIETLLNRIHTPHLAAGALYELARHWMYTGDTVRGRAACERIIAANASEWHVKHARGILHEMSDLNVGQMAPVFAVDDIDGRPFDLVELRGKTVLIDFWATWCTPCRGEFPHLRRIHERYKDKGFTIVSISLDDDCEAARRMIGKEQLAWRHICQSGWGAPLASLYNVLGIPKTILIGTDGRIVAKGLRDHDLETTVARVVEPGEAVQQAEKK